MLRLMWRGASRSYIRAGTLSVMSTTAIFLLSPMEPRLSSTVTVFKFALAERSICAKWVSQHIHRRNCRTSLSITSFAHKTMIALVQLSYFSIYCSWGDTRLLEGTTDPDTCQLSAQLENADVLSDDSPQTC